MVNERPETQTERPRKTKARRILRLFFIVIGASVAGAFVTWFIVAPLLYDPNYSGSNSNTAAVVTWFLVAPLFYGPNDPDLAFLIIATGLVFGLVPSLICAGLGYLSRQRYGVEIGALIGGILVGPVVAYLFTPWLFSLTPVFCC